MKNLKSLLIATALANLAACATNVTVRVSIIDYDTQEYVTNAWAKASSTTPYGGLPVPGWTLVPSDSEYNRYVWHIETSGPFDCDFSTYDGFFRFGVWAENHYMNDVREYRFAPVPGKAGEFATLAETVKEMTVYLRKVRNPIVMYSLGARSNYWDYLTDTLTTRYSYPTNTVEAGFDMMAGDWVAPYGIGTTADFYVQKSVVVSNGIEQTVAALVFRGEGNGAYLAQKAPVEEFWSVYHADPGATYSQTFPQTDGFIVGTNDYLVVRTRAATNETGAVASAHYGKIYGSIRVGKKSPRSQDPKDYFFFMSYALNPNPNDTNLENARDDSKVSPKITWVKRKGKGLP